MRSTIDVMGRGTLMNKIEDKVSNLIEETTFNNY